ncbi:MAG: secondary thiamine-phosphate synthase enzyme YjbQ [Candidatus Helarchaeota archaeon]
MINMISINTSKREEIIDITNEVAKILKKSNISDGYCVVFVTHTTAGITINENADPAVKRDILKILDKAIPFNNNYEHMEGNSAAHMKSIICGFSQTIPIEHGRLVLGTWQGIYFCEFDGPRTRNVLVKIVKDN